MARRGTSYRQRDSGCKFNNHNPICREPLNIATWVLKPATKIFPTAAPLPVAPSFVPPPLTWVCCPGGAGGLPPTSLSCSLSQRATGLEDPRLRGLRDQPTNHPLPEKFQPNEKYILSWNIPLSEIFCSKVGTWVHRAFSWGSKSR